MAVKGTGNAAKIISVHCNIMNRKDAYFGNSYGIVARILKTQKRTAEIGMSLSIKDIILELSWNDIGYDMNGDRKGGSTTMNRLPIYALFVYFGCRSHGEMNDFIFPGVSPSDPRRQMLAAAVVDGPYHSAFNNVVGGQVPMTRQAVIFYIGEKIINERYKTLYREEIEADVKELAGEMKMDEPLILSTIEVLYRRKICDRVQAILNGTFYFNVNHDARKVCIQMGDMIAQLIRIDLGFEDECDRNSVATRRVQPVGEQFTSELKRYFEKKAITPIVEKVRREVFDIMPWDKLQSHLEEIVKGSLGTLGTGLATQMVSAFKAATKAEDKQPRLQEEQLDAKNILFLESKKGEITIRPVKGGKTGAIYYVRRQAHPTFPLFIDPDQTPEAGADVGRYQQPTISSILSLCQSETPVREILGMADTRHPSVLRAASVAAKVATTIPPIWGTMFAGLQHESMGEKSGEGKSEEKESASSLSSSSTSSSPTELPSRLGLVSFSEMAGGKESGKPVEKRETCVTLFGFTEIIPDSQELFNYYKVYLNGSIVGVIPRGPNVEKMYVWLMEKRRDTIHYTTGITLDRVGRVIDIYTDAGRLMTPLIPARFILDEKERSRLNLFIDDMDVDFKESSPSHRYGNWWDKLIAEGFIEVFDAGMMENTVVAQSVQDLLDRPNICQHVSHPLETCGIISAVNSALHLSKGSRLLYSCNYLKQGMGKTIHNPYTNYIPEINLLRRAQLPLARSVAYNLLGVDQYPFMENIIVMFAPYQFNQADAVIINQGSDDRGLLSAEHVTSYTFTLEPTNASFGVPADYESLSGPKAKMESYKKVDAKYGIPIRIGSTFGQGDAIAVITEPATRTENGVEVVRLRDCTEIMEKDHCPDDRHPCPARLTAAYSSIASHDRSRQLQFSSVRYMSDGDKVASAGAQKGVAGQIRPEKLMPHTRQGVRPDIIFNPPGGIRRETYFQQCGALLGKICAHLGTSIDATPYLSAPVFQWKKVKPVGYNEVMSERSTRIYLSDVSVDRLSSSDVQKNGLNATVLISYLLETNIAEDFDKIKEKYAELTGGTIEEELMSGTYPPELSKILSSLGFDDRGTEEMFDPITGRAFEMRVFIGVLSYMREKRMVADLIHDRYQGRRDAFTHQPTRGKAKQGGVAFGEMERMAAGASGASHEIRDAMFTQAAPAIVEVCDRCGAPCYTPADNPLVYRCDRDGILDPGIAHRMRAPYISQLLPAILLGCGVEMTTLTGAACIVDTAAIPVPMPSMTYVVAKEASKNEPKK
jgi:DNA-directed RNA polymerase beta subunit